VPLRILAEAEHTKELAWDNAQANANAGSNPQATDRDTQPSRAQCGHTVGCALPPPPI